MQDGTVSQDCYDYLKALVIQELHRNRKNQVFEEGPLRRLRDWSICQVRRGLASRREGSGVISSMCIST